MTESEWLACTNPTRMLRYVRSKMGNRKLRLFAVACCRRIWHLFTDDNNRQAVELAERLADGLATTAEARTAGLDARGGAGDAGGAAAGAVRVNPQEAAELASTSAAMAFATTRELLFLPDYEINPAWQSLHAAERASQCELLRDIFGVLPFPRVMLHPVWLAWNGGTVVKLAETIYDERAFDRLPILADALEDASCTDPTVLNHLREPGLHVRGCFVIDALLGKT